MTAQDRVKSAPALHFIEALAQNEISASYNLQLPANLKGPALIQAEVLLSLQNLAYEVWLFDSATNLTGAPETDHFLGMWQFGVIGVGQPGMTVTPVGGIANTLFRFYTDGLAIPYWDQDSLVAGYVGPSFLHVRLVNRSVGGKLANPGGGALQVQFLVSPQEWV
jgi:hypothetical protein